MILCSTSQQHKYKGLPEADPGFSQGGCANSKGGCKMLLFLQIYIQNLHEIESNWIPSGGVFLAPPLQSANGCEHGVKAHSHGAIANATKLFLV